MVLPAMQVENIPAFLAGVKAKKEKMSGFGHRVYRNFDPRAKIIKGVAEDVFELAGKDPLIEVAKALQVCMAAVHGVVCCITTVVVMG